MTWAKPRREPTQSTYTPRPRAPAVAVAGPARATVAVPKLPKTKPGKRAPTVEEAAWMDFITSIGCIACLIDGHPGTPGAVHHILRGGRRIGHLHSICLCDPGHHQNGTDKISRHPWKARFEAKYGTEAELLAMSQKLKGAYAA
jgi:hypothetical protein